MLNNRTTESVAKTSSMSIVRDVRKSDQGNLRGFYSFSINPERYLSGAASSSLRFRPSPQSQHTGSVDMVLCSVALRSDRSVDEIVSQVM